MASEYDFQGPGVVKPHPKKNWVNPDAHPVHGPEAGRARRGASPRAAAPSGPTADQPVTGGTGRSPMRLVLGALALVALLVAIALVVVFVIS